MVSDFSTTAPGTAWNELGRSPRVFEWEAKGLEYGLGGWELRLDPALRQGRLQLPHTAWSDTGFYQEQCGDVFQRLELR